MSINKALAQKARQLRLQKGLSQNFLVDDSALARIADAGTTGDTTLPIVEIGAGAGFLTRHLLATGHPVTAIEVDPKMIGVLSEEFKDHPGFRLIHNDVRQVDLLALLQPRGIVVGNIPYHLTGPILFQLIGELTDATYPLRQHLEKAVLMVQKEVGERLVAKPGHTAYSQLTLQAQYWFQTQAILHIPRSVFVPSPKVDSMVVALTPRTEPAVSVKDLVSFGRLVKAAFQHRRKTLYNNLKLGQFGSGEALMATLDHLGLSSTARAQELSMEQFGALANALTP